MYNIPNISVHDSEPWNIPFERRTRDLREALQSGARVCVLLCEEANTSTFRYRAYNLMQSTAAGSVWRCLYFFYDELDRAEQLLYKTDMISVIRMRWTKRLDRIIKKLKADGIPVLFDIDDLIYDLEYLPQITNTLNIPESDIDFDFWCAYIGRVGMTASLADGFTTTNSFLGKMLSGKYGKPFGVIPNFLNDEQLYVSNLHCRKKSKTKSTGAFTIGYFSGTPTHTNDFKLIYPELIQLLLKYPDIHLQVVGFMDFPEDVQPLLLDNRISFVPLVDFLKLQHLIAAADVNIVPLANSIFTNCKSELKFFEAAIVDTITVASPAFTYKNAIENGKTGFLCKPGEWYEILEQLYFHEIDVASINAAARNYALSHYSGEAIKNTIEETYDLLYKTCK
jgi:glycosyltransferase involved in cell wall biosynthesis